MRAKVRESFNDAMQILLNLCGELVQEPTQENAFRIRCTHDILKDMGMMRDCLDETYSIPWEQYKVRFCDAVARVGKQ